MFQNVKCVLVLSGGMDSGTLLFDLIDNLCSVYTISFDYGQRHKKELIAAKALADHAGVHHEIINLSGLRGLFAGSSQTDDTVPVPEGHYAEENMKKTVVPNRNMIMLALATARAITLDYQAVVYGAHGGDHAIYPDCRPEFIGAMTSAIYLADWKKINLLAPYVYMNKISILKRGMALGVPYEKTWTCYAGQELSCGKCGSCQERLEAFRENKIVDPLDYAHV
jgi:7-cyano-7-deazaguanine synthase